MGSDAAGDFHAARNERLDAIFGGSVLVKEGGASPTNWVAKRILYDRLMELLEQSVVSI